MGLITTLVVSFLVCCVLEVRCGYVGVVSGLQASLQPGHYSSLTTSKCVSIQQTKKETTNCGNQHHSRELLMMGIVVPETC